MNFEDMRQRVATGEGFIAALDQSGGSTPKALKGYGIEEGAWTGEDEMFALIHRMRQRIIESPCFGNGKVIGAILFERQWTATAAAERAGAFGGSGVVPFLKVDNGSRGGGRGVQLMCPIRGSRHCASGRRAKGVSAPRCAA